MMRKPPFTSMQKTYDECYLICSTAIYFEGQNNEAEALRSWRSALDQIYYHNAYRMPSNYQPKTETERALQESLRSMELQCKERVDLLEALRKSRLEAEQEAKDGNSGPPMSKGPVHRALTPKASQDSNGWLGQGTVPPASYPDLSRPPSLPARPTRAAPSRPSYTSKKSSSKDTPRAQSLTSSTLQPNLSPPVNVEQSRRGSRTPSPEKRGGMLKTLRAGGKERTSSGRMVSSLRNGGNLAAPSSAKAATLAWGTTQRPSIGSLEQAGESAGSSNAPTWDPYTRRLVERPSSRGTLTDGERRASNNTLVRPPSPSDYLTVRPEESSRPMSHPTPYPEYPIMDPYSKQAFAHSDDNLAPDAAPEPPQHQAQSSPIVIPTVQPRRPSPPRIPKIDPSALSYRKEYLTPSPGKLRKPPTVPSKKPSDASSGPDRPVRVSNNRTMQAKPSPTIPRKAVNVVTAAAERRSFDNMGNPSGASKHDSTTSNTDHTSSDADFAPRPQRRRSKNGKTVARVKTPPSPGSADSDHPETPSEEQMWDDRVKHLMKNLPKGVDEGAAKQIFNEIVIQGDEVHWDDVAGLEIAKDALKETVVYPFLRPDLFMGLREPARGMLLFGPPGTGKTMLARAVATESKSTFFAISASSLTSKFLGESEKLVRALFSIAKALAPSIIFVDEIDSLLSSRGGGSEHEATRRIKTEFLIQWSDLAKAAAGRERSENDKERGDASRVLVLAATNLPWAIDEAARRRFVRRQYIPLPEEWVREKQLRTLLSAQKHRLTDSDLKQLVKLTDCFSGSDITALAKDAAMGPLRSLGARLLNMSPDDIRPIQMEDFKASLVNIRPSVSRQGLKEFEDWAREFGERGG